MEPDFMVVLALAARDTGDAPRAGALMSEAAARSGRPDLAALAGAPLSVWPATLRQIRLARERASGSAAR
jgi:hypothetical protein